MDEAVLGQETLPAASKAVDNECVCDVCVWVCVCALTIVE